MSPYDQEPAVTEAMAGWENVCLLEDILPNTGVCAWLFGRQLAVFRVGETDQVYAIDNFDPNSKANVLSRGLIGDVQGEVVVASPIFKQHFSLKTGRCLEKPEASIRAYAACVMRGRVWVAPMEQH